MRYHALVPLLAALVNIIVCIPVLRQGMRKPLTRAFACLTLAIASWNLDIFALYYFTDAGDAEWWSRVFRTGVCFAPALALHTAALLAGTWRGPWRVLGWVGYLAGALLAVVNFEGGLVQRLTPHVWGWYIQGTRAYALLTILLVVFLPFHLERTWHAYRHPSSSRQRVQAKFWLLGAVIQVPFALTNLLPIYGFAIYPLGNLGNVFYVSIMAYAIVRHRLMDVDYVVRKFVSFSIASAVVLLPGALAISALARVLGAEEPSVIVCASLALALVAVVLVPTFQEALESRVHRAFFPQLYDYRLRLRHLGTALVHIL